MKKTIGIIGSGLIGPALSSCSIDIKEINEKDRIRREFKNEFQKAFNLPDNGKCNKGHSYEKEYDEKITMKVIWKCTKCGKRL